MNTFVSQSWKSLSVCPIISTGIFDSDVVFQNVPFCCRLHEFDDQVKWVREGMARVVPVPLLSLFTGYELETMVRQVLSFPIPERN